MKKRSTNLIRPNFLSLERRDCMSSVILDPVSHAVSVTGSDAADRVSVVEKFVGNGYSFEIDLNNAAYNFAPNAVSRIDIDLKGGDDSFDYHPADASIPSSASFALPSVTVDLGEGNNTANILLGDTIRKATQTIGITAGSGRDTVSASFGYQVSGIENFYAYLGAGDDTFTSRIYNGIDTGRVAVKVFGEAGNDTLTGGIEYDYFDGGDGNDTLHGGDGSDTLRGGTGIDYLYGEGGDDHLDGGDDGTRDFLYGGAGSDTFEQHGDPKSIVGGQDSIMDLGVGDIIHGVRLPGDIFRKLG